MAGRAKCVYSRYTTARRAHLLQCRGAGQHALKVLRDRPKRGVRNPARMLGKDLLHYMQRLLNTLLQTHREPVTICARQDHGEAHPWNRKKNERVKCSQVPDGIP
jgi:hypothetical protein